MTIGLFGDIFIYAFKFLSCEMAVDFIFQTLYSNVNTMQLLYEAALLEAVTLLLKEASWLLSLEKIET